MIKKEHHALVIILLTALAALVFILLSMFFATPLDARDGDENATRMQPPHIQQPRPPVSPAPLRMAPPKAGHVQGPKALETPKNEGGIVSKKEEPVVPGAESIKIGEKSKSEKPLLRKVTPPAEGKAIETTGAETKKILPEAAVGAKQALATPQAGAKSGHGEHRHHRHNHGVIDNFFVYPYGDDDYSDDSSDNTPYVEDQAGDEDEDDTSSDAAASYSLSHDFDNRYGLAQNSGELYVDASEIASADRLAQLKGIEGLDLTVVQADDATFQRLLDVPNLESLKISGKMITQIPAGISRLNNLQWLDVSGNQIKVVPAEIGKLAKLEQLILSNNKIKELPPEIGNLLKLKGLYLANNDLASLPVEITRLSKIKALDLSGNPGSILVNPPEIKQWVNNLNTHMAKVRI